MRYAWLIWSLGLLLVWAIVYVSLRSRESQREMLITSLWTSLLGLTEPLFVPAYWNPPSLFNLAQRTGFDFESFLFSFGIGGLAVVIYEWIISVRHQHIAFRERHLARHRLHLAVLSAAPVMFAVLLGRGLNPIYAAILALAGGGLLTWYCRPDLMRKMIVSAVLFSVLYFVYFRTLVIVYPDYVQTVWNLRAISGIQILGVPLEELAFAFALGFMWSSVYEHIRWRRLEPALPQAHVETARSQP